MFRSLRALTAAFLLAFLTATILTGVATYGFTRAAIARLVDERVASASFAVAEPGMPVDRAGVLRRIAGMMRQRDTGDLGFVLTDAAGEWLGGNLRLGRPLPLGYATLGPGTGIHGLSEGRALTRRIGGGMVLTTIAETEPLDNYNAARIRIYAAGFGSIVLVVIGGLIVFGLIVHRRIADIRRTAEAIVDGDMRRRVPEGGTNSAFDQQAQAFNRMLDRIADLMAAMRDVSNDIAHDLRAPLARLRAQLTQLARGAGNEATRVEAEAAIARCDEMLAMFAAVLRIAEVEGGDRRAAFERLDLGRLAADMATMMQPIAEEEGHGLVAGVCAEAWVQGDRQLLSQALINLIENALRHTPPGTRVVVAVARTAEGATLTVADTGPGIAPDRHGLALRRFGRLDESRGGPGHGLGLALVDAIARLHRGSIRLEDARPGLRVLFSLPVSPE